MAFLSGYNSRKSLTIDSDAELSGDLTDRAVKIHLDNSESDFWDNSPPVAGTGVRFTDSNGTTLLDFQEEQYDTTADDGIWHVEIPTLDASADTLIYVYYEADSESDGSDKEGTWNANVVASYLLNEDAPDGAFDDGTSNSFDLTNSGTISATDLIGKARDFDGTDDLMSRADHANLDFGTSDFSFEAIIRPDAVNINAVITSKASATVGWWGRARSTAFAQFQTVDGGGSTEATGTTTLVADSAYHIMGGRAGTSHLIYVQGALDGTTVGTVRNVDNANDYEIGVRNTATNFFNGTIDNVILYDVGPTLDRANAGYQSYLGTWLTIGARETAPTGGIEVLRRRIEGC